MGRIDKIGLIEHLLLCTVDAHAHYQQEVLRGDTDCKWAEWFAEYLIGHGLDNLIGDELDVETIAATIEEIEKEHRVKPSDTPWMHLAAAKMVKLGNSSAF